MQEMATIEEYRKVLKGNWGYDSFRGVQEEIILSIGAGKDTLGLMPTGGGKSVCFQVPTLAMDGMCIVVTPLIALMKDQVSQLRMRDIKAEAVYSGMMRSDIERVLENCVFGNFKFLYVSPERLGTELFQAKLRYMKNICMICVDEAHCISQWGYDFRPSYLQIAELRKMIPYHVPVLALTATATPKVVDDIQEKLCFKQKNVYSMSFERKNLTYVVRRTENKDDELVHILDSVKSGSAIVYTRSRRLTSEIAHNLELAGISAENYHAGLTEAERDLRQKNWTKGRCRVMVATNAFGMGIDKADVRLVIHYNIPDSIEAYFQEAGRAGRDGKRSYAVLLYNPQDRGKLHRRIPETYPDKDYIRGTYENICYFFQIGIGEALNRTFQFSMEKFCKTFRQFPVQTDSSLHLLHNAGYIDYCTDPDFKSRVRFALSKEDLYRLHEGSQRREAIINCLLRTYTGLFADYTYIDELQMSHLTGIGVEAIYEELKGLAQYRIIDYIPRSNQPTITFLCGRVDTEMVYLSEDVYDKRKEDLTQRIDKILDYASSTNRCRSRMLLEYFGQRDAKDCGLCDVCRSLKHKKSSTVAASEQRVEEQISVLLSDGEWHSLKELNTLNVNRSRMDEALKTMAEEELIDMHLGKIRINKKDK